MKTDGIKQVEMTNTETTPDNAGDQDQAQGINAQEQDNNKVFSQNEPKDEEPPEE